jgi:hypothetical protein
VIRPTLTTLRLALLCATYAGSISAHADESVDALKKRLAAMEARMAALEKKPAPSYSSNRGSSSISPAAMDILTKSAWRDLRWTEQKQWDNLRHGMSIQEVVELLGRPPRSVKSLKPKIDLVYFYEASLLDSSSTIKGKVSFKNGVVVDFQTPDFQSVQGHRKKR